MAGIVERLDSPTVRIAGALLLAALVATIAYVLQSQDIQRCIEAGEPRAVCSARHRNIVEVVGVGAVMMFLTLTPKMLTSNGRARLVEKIPLLRPVHPDADEDRSRLVRAGRVGVPASVAFTVLLVFWLVLRDLDGAWATLIGVGCVISGVAWAGSFVYALAVRRRIPRAEP